MWEDVADDDEERKLISVGNLLSTHPSLSFYYFRNIGVSDWEV